MFEGFALHRGYGWGVLIGFENGFGCMGGVENVIVRLVGAIGGFCGRFVV